MKPCFPYFRIFYNLPASMVQDHTCSSLNHILYSEPYLLIFYIINIINLTFYVIMVLYNNRTKKSSVASNFIENAHVKNSY